MDRPADQLVGFEGTAFLLQQREAEHLAVVVARLQHPPERAGGDGIELVGERTGEQRVDRGVQAFEGFLAEQERIPLAHQLARGFAVTGGDPA